MSGDRPTLVLLHPLGVDRHFWDPVRAVLPSSLGDVVALDLLGHGSAAELADGGDLTDLADDVEKQLADRDRVHLVGMSLGGLVAQELAARRSGLVDRLVLADAVAVYPDTMRAMWRDRAALVRAEGLSAVVEPTEALWFTEQFRRDQPARVATVRSSFLAGDPEQYARSCALLADVDTTSAVRDIEATTLVLCGEDDAPPFRMAVDWFASALAAASVGWLPGRHATAYEHPTPFAEELTLFLAG